MPNGQRHCDACGKAIPLDYTVNPRIFRFDNGTGNGTEVQVAPLVEVTDTPFESVDGPDICGDCIVRVLVEGTEVA